MCFVFFSELKFLFFDSQKIVLQENYIFWHDACLIFQNCPLNQKFPINYCIFRALEWHIPEELLGEYYLAIFECTLLMKEASINLSDVLGLEWDRC